MAVYKQYQVTFVNKSKEAEELFHLADRTRIIIVDGVEYGMSGGIVGLYDSEEVARRVAESLSAIHNDDWMDECYGLLCGPSRYSVRALTMGAEPTMQLGWMYVE